MTPLLLVDGHHLLYRSWWGFSGRRILSRDKQRDLTGVFGFLAILRKTHLEELPDHEIIVIFDGENAHTTRQPHDATYKANRATADHTPIKSLRPVKDALTHLGVPWLELDDHEADDVIATLTHTATANGRPVTCYSGDRDLFQLLDHPAVTLLNPARHRLTGPDIQERHQVTARQWPDYRALTGDPADNIPGISGIGPKTAAALLADGLHLDDLPGSPRLRTPRCRGITDHWDQLLTWRDLIRLNRSIPIPTPPGTDAPTPPLPRAARTLEDLNLW
ncbi:5'-3' exonuclease H3TH domain-containing protein [Actinomadura sp. SCN-SB]|uniref:5'-3' exonuclease n=1 Tax=Actinomadura sp. SCN-SB TaxID=3373092 RepID=UPI00375387A4